MHENKEIYVLFEYAPNKLNITLKFPEIVLNMITNQLSQFHKFVIWQISR